MPAGAMSGGGKVQNVKLLLLGGQGVGKSSIALRFVRGEFEENSGATIGAAFLTQAMSVSGQTVKFDIWDTAGQSRYQLFTSMYYRGAQAAVVVYDLTNMKGQSFAEENNLICIEASAKTGMCVGDVFMTIDTFTADEPSLDTSTADEPSSKDTFTTDEPSSDSDDRQTETLAAANFIAVDAVDEGLYFTISPW
ncbi:ras-related protein Rab-5C-like [Mya arenaria]|uniref:ras-related protein Rab-5C-like n=1 Tax=Mya arenaria TaxID=6604 RepID=UPI0022E22C15|nr:ras-related protein Rab-5C-like [Mya arenaria]